MALATLSLSAALPAESGATWLAARTFRVAPPRVEPNGPSSEPSVSDSGRFVAFTSTASDFGPDDVFGVPHVYLTDLLNGATWLVSSGLHGEPADGPSSAPSVSRDAFIVAFASRASNLVRGDHGHVMNIFVRAALGPMLQITHAADGGEPDGDSSQPVVSADGRYVAFTSSADDLVPGDDNSASDVFRYDLYTKTLIRISVSSRGEQANGPSAAPAISADGRYVSFASSAADLVPHDRNHLPDVFVRDTQKGTTKLVSVSGHGQQQNAAVPAPYTQISALSADGRYVTFDSAATNLAAGADAGYTQVYRHDLRTGATILVSRSSLGEPADDDSFYPEISDDGNLVSFDSYATDLAEPWVPVVNVYLRDISRGTTSLIDVTAAGAARDLEPAGALIQRPALAGSGDLLAFVSGADNLVPNDYNGAVDAFARLIAPPATTLVRAPAARAHDRRPVVEFRGDDPASRFGLCSLDGVRSICPAGRAFRLPRLARGRHRLMIRAGGPGMLFDPQGISVNFTIL